MKDFGRESFDNKVLEFIFLYSSFDSLNTITLYYLDPNVQTKFHYSSIAKREFINNTNIYKKYKSLFRTSQENNHNRRSASSQNNEIYKQTKENNESKEKSQLNTKNINLAGENKEIFHSHLNLTNIYHQDVETTLITRSID